MSILDFALLSEIHTSDLQSSCLKRVQLRHEGNVLPQCETAKYRGLCAGKAIEALHADDDWSDERLHACVRSAGESIDTELEERGEPLSDAVIRDREKIDGEVLKMLGHYAERMPSFYGDIEQIGLEVPIRWDIPVEGGVPFASHLDYLGRRTDGSLVVVDFKWTEHTPTYAYLDRNLQFITYWLAVKYGEVLVEGHWIQMNEHPRLVWLHLPSLFPYKRKRTETNKETGEVTEYKSGDERPWSSIAYWDRFDPRSQSACIDLLRTRIKMIEHGLFPTNPDPVGCHICEGRYHCPSAKGERT